MEQINTVTNYSRKVTINLTASDDDISSGSNPGAAVEWYTTRVIVSNAGERSILAS